MKKFIQQIAADNNLPYDIVYADMQEAINIAFANKDKENDYLWKLFSSSTPPSVEEFLFVVTNMITNNDIKS